MSQKLLIQVLLSAVAFFAGLVLLDIHASVKNTERLVIAVAVLQTEHEGFKAEHKVFQAFGDDIEGLKATQAKLIDWKQRVEENN